MSASNALILAAAASASASANNNHNNNIVYDQSKICRFNGVDGGNHHHQHQCHHHHLFHQMKLLHQCYHQTHDQQQQPKQQVNQFEMIDNNNTNDNDGDSMIIIQSNQICNICTNNQNNDDNNNNEEMTMKMGVDHRRNGCGLFLVDQLNLNNDDQSSSILPSSMITIDDFVENQFENRIDSNNNSNSIIPTDLQPNHQHQQQQQDAVDHDQHDESVHLLCDYHHQHQQQQQQHDYSYDNLHHQLQHQQQQQLQGHHLQKSCDQRTSNNQLYQQKQCGKQQRKSFDLKHSNSEQQQPKQPAAIQSLNKRVELEFSMFNDSKNTTSNNHTTKQLESYSIVKPLTAHHHQRQSLNSLLPNSLKSTKPFPTTCFDSSPFDHCENNYPGEQCPKINFFDDQNCSKKPYLCQTIDNIDDYHQNQSTKLLIQDSINSYDSKLNQIDFNFLYNPSPLPPPPPQISSTPLISSLSSSNNDNNHPNQFDLCEPKHSNQTNNSKLTLSSSSTSISSDFTIKQLSSTTSPSSSSTVTTSICLSTIMEILPLILLLTMGVIISTTCAKYRFQQQQQQSSATYLIPSIVSNSSSSAAFNDYLRQNSTSDQLIQINNNQSMNDDSFMNVMMNDEEASSSASFVNDQPHLNHHQSMYQRHQQLDSSKSSKSLSTIESQQQQQQQQQLFAQLAHQYSAMQLQWLSNSSVTCNDGTRAGYYIRPSPNGSKRWLIFLEGGWYCMSKSACDQRWYKMRDFMTSFRWSQYKTVSGILSSSPSMNPYWWNANHVFIPYCSSDIWSGDQPAKPPQMAMSFLGSRILDEVINELIRSPKYQFLDSKFILLAGSSAGAAGVMINLDRIAKMIADSGCKADVRGLADSGWIMDLDDYPHNHNEGDKSGSSSSSCTDGICSPSETIRGAYKLWNSRVPESCAKHYPSEPWRCYFGYRLYPTLSTPLFVIQFQYDEFQLYMDGLANQALNEIERIHYIRSSSKQMIQTLANVSAIFIPSCMSHILLTKIDWYKISIDGITLPDALNCWEQTPVNYNNHHNYHRSNHHHYYFNPHQFNHYSSLNQRYPSSSTQSKYSIYSKSNDYSLLFDQSNHPSSQPVQQQPNELTQFYNSPITNDYRVNNNNYLPIKTTKNQSNINYLYQKNDQLKQEESSWLKLPETSMNDADKPADTSSPSSTSSAAALSAVDNNNINRSIEPTSGKNRRKKRKRRKHHNHRKMMLQQQSSTLSSIDNQNQNDYNRLLLLNQPKYSQSLQSYYQQSLPSSSSSSLSRNSYWNPSSYPYTHQQHVHLPHRTCHYRLIDHYEYPQRNTECPRLQFNHNHHNQPSTMSTISTLLSSSNSNSNNINDNSDNHHQNGNNGNHHDHDNDHDQYIKSYKL